MNPNELTFLPQTTLKNVKIRQFFKKAWGFTEDITELKAQITKDNTSDSAIVKMVVERLMKYQDPDLKICRLHFNKLKLVIDQVCNSKNALLTSSYRTQIIKFVIADLKMSFIKFVDQYYCFWLKPAKFKV